MRGRAGAAVGRARAAGVGAIASVGIIANPASGKDIRRLIAACSVVDNNEKVNIVRRALAGLSALGIDTVHYMPEHFGIVARAVRESKLPLEAHPVEILAVGAAQDSTRAAAAMRELGVGCIITLGGDGTNRVVARGCGEVPLVALSTGTNNAFPVSVDGTLGGLAAGLVATGAVDGGAVRRSKRLELCLDDRPADLALVDVVVSAERFIGARAIWDLGPVSDLVLTMAEPGSLGFSAIGAHLEPIGRDEPAGLHVELGEGDLVRAPIGPGLLRDVPVRRWRRIAPGERVPLGGGLGVVALDGEKELELDAGQRVSVVLREDGPRLVDVRAALAGAARRGLFHREAARSGPR